MKVKFQGNKPLKKVNTKRKSVLIDILIFLLSIVLAATLIFVIAYAKGEL